MRFLTPLLPAVAMMVVLGGCLPIPEVRIPLDVEPPAYRMAPSTVAVAPLALRGTDEPHTPERFDQIRALRFKASEQPVAVLVLMPGLGAGAASLETLARQLVAATPGLQVWVVDRRANALEDRRGFRLAWQAGDPSLAIDYYLGSSAIPPAFRALGAEVSRLPAYWGLRTQLADLAAVVAAANHVAPAVYLGGHSFGASMAALYAAFELPDGGIGSESIDGLVLLDGVPGRTGAFGEHDVLLSGVRVLSIPVVPSVRDLETGRARATLRDPMDSIRSQLIAFAAALRPGALADPRLVGYRITNFALAGVSNDAGYAPVPMLAARLGHATGAAHAGNLLAFLLSGVEAVGSRSIVGPAAGVDHVGWTIGDPPAPSDLTAFVAASVDPYADRWEWYFPTRVLLDMAALDIDLEHAEGFAPTARVTVPTLAIGAGGGLVRSLDVFAAYANARVGTSFRSYIVPGLSHIDLINARAAPVVTLFQGWVREAAPPASLASGRTASP